EILGPRALELTRRDAGFGAGELGGALKTQDEQAPRTRARQQRLQRAAEAVRVGEGGSHQPPARGPDAAFELARRTRRLHGEAGAWRMFFVSRRPMQESVDLVVEPNHGWSQPALQQATDDLAAYLDARHFPAAQEAQLRRGPHAQRGA